MKKKMIMIGTAAIIAVVIFFVGWYVMFVHFGRGPTFPLLLTATIETKGAGSMPLAENPLMATVDTKEEAEEIAELYGIALASFENGVAVYGTEEDPMQVIARGQENNYPQLSLNLKRELHTDTNANTKVFDVQRIE